MKKLLSIIMLLNFAPMIICSQDDLNKKLAYETLTDISDGIAHCIKCPIKAIIPGCSVACLAKEACKENDSSKFENIQDRFFRTGIKSWYAFLFLACAKTAPIKVFLGAHAISGIGAILGYNFAEKKYQYLYNDAQRKKMLNVKKQHDEAQKEHDEYRKKLFDECGKKIDKIGSFQNQTTNK